MKNINLNHRISKLKENKQHFHHSLWALCSPWLKKSLLTLGALLYRWVFKKIADITEKLEIPPKGERNMGTFKNGQFLFMHSKESSDNLILRKYNLNALKSTLSN